MLSENLRLHEALAKLDAKDVRVQAALAATQANWHASRQAWPEAVAAFDRLVAADPSGTRAPGSARPDCFAWRRPCCIRIGLPSRPCCCKEAQNAAPRMGFPPPLTRWELACVRGRGRRSPSDRAAAWVPGRRGPAFVRATSS